VTIFRLIKDSAFGPHQIKVMTEAYEATLKALHLKTGTEPINELIANKIIGIVQAKEHDPKRICARTIKELGRERVAHQFGAGHDCSICKQFAWNIFCVIVP
jgi:hypothetical protein